MTRVLSVLLIVFVASLAACKAHDHGAGHAADEHVGHMEAPADAPATAPADAPATAPADVLPNDGTRKVGDITACAVTGKVFTVAEDTAKTEHDGGTYYFCCGGCAGKFNKDPAKYLNAAAPESEPASMSGEVLPNDGTRKVGDVTRCPTSDEVFTIEADSPKYEHDGKTIWFCCDGCVDKYKATL